MSVKSDNIIFGFIGISAVGLFLWNTYNKGKEFVERLQLKIKYRGLPTFTSGTALVPLTLELTNPVDFGISISDLTINILMRQADGTYKEVGNLIKPETIRIPAHSIENIEVNPQVNFNNINPWAGQSITDILQSVFDSGTIAKLRIDYSFLAENIAQTGSEFKDITLPKF